MSLGQRITALYRRSPSWMMGWRNLNRNIIRSGLAALGIVIGVLAIASLGMVGGAIQYSTAQNLESLANQVTVTAGQDNPADGFTPTDVRDLERLATDQTVVPQKTNRTVIRGRRTETAVRVTGVTNADALYTAVEGTVPTRLRSGAMLSREAADELGLQLGDPVVYEGTSYRIVAITEPAGFGPAQGGGTLVLPVAALADQPRFDVVTVVAANGADAERYADRVETTFNTDDEVFGVSTFSTIQDSIDAFLETLNLALLAIGSISLIVASVAILNVMLMSTIERRGEIGVLRAVGIRRAEVLRMILAEAALVGIVGGIVGAVLSLGIGLGLNALLFDDPSLVFTWTSIRYVIFGPIFGVVASLLSGLYPAWKAANDPPVEALRG